MPYRYGILALLSLSTLVNYLDRQALAVVVPELRREMSLSSSEYGNILTAFLIAYSAGQVLAGGVIDRVGVRWGLGVFVAVWSVAAMAHGLAQSAAQLFAVRILLGVGEAGNWPAGVKAISEWYPRKERALSMGIFDGGSALGAVLATPIVAALTLAYGWRSALIATGAIGFVWLAFWIALYRPSPASKAAPAGLAGSDSLPSRALCGLMATRLLATPVWWFYVFWLPDYLGQGRGLTLREIGLFGWVPYIAADLGKLIGGRLSDRLIAEGREATRARKVIMGAAACCMAGGLFVVEASSALAALTWVSLATFGFGMWSANILALHADLFPSARIATAVGWTTAASGLGGAAFTWFTGRLVDAQGYALVFAMAGSAALIAFAVLWFVVQPSDSIEETA